MSAALVSCSAVDSDAQHTRSLHANQQNGRDMTPNENTNSDTGAITARDGNIAIVEEFTRAKSKGTIAAFELFILDEPLGDIQEFLKEFNKNQFKHHLSIGCRRAGFLSTYLGKR